MAKTASGPSTAGTSGETVPERVYVFLPRLVDNVGHAAPRLADAPANVDSSSDDNLFVVEWQLLPAKADVS
jgi:hypothetical protein